MNKIIKNGDIFTLLDFNKLLEKCFDNVYDDIAELSDTNGYFTIKEFGEINLSWDENASTICNYDNDEYYIIEFLYIVRNSLKK